jgi:hypothetical protein
MLAPQNFLAYWMVVWLSNSFGHCLMSQLKVSEKGLKIIQPFNQSTVILQNCCLLFVSFLLDKLQITLKSSLSLQS